MSTANLLGTNCPVCGGYRMSSKGRMKRVNDCREYEGMIQCFSHNDAPLGYVYKGLSDIGSSMYVPEREEKIEDWEAHRQEMARLAKENAEKRKIERQRKIDALPTMAKKHDDILLLQRTPITPYQRKDLLRRGLTEAEVSFVINAGWVFGHNYSYGIAAIDPLTKLFCGAQRALDKRDDKKYDWGVFAGQNWLKETGENPLFVWTHPAFKKTEKYTVAFTEGSLKSLIFAMLNWRINTQVVIVGAAGGLFTEAAVKRVNKYFLDANQYIFCPDAGSLNPQKRNLYRGYKELADVIPTIRFADWGHWQDDNAQDCDEYFLDHGFADCELKHSGRWLRTFEQLVEEVEESKKEILSDTEFDGQYSLLAKNTPLTLPHQQELASLGLREDQMKLYKIFSIANGQKATRGVTDKFPGVNRTSQGLSLFFKQDGYTIPLFNANGLVIAHKVYSQNIKGYRWASGRQIPKLKDSNEPPLSVVCQTPSSGEVKGLWFLVDDARKGILYNARLGLDALAAPNGNFEASQTQLEKFIAVKNPSSLVLVPNAGDIESKERRLHWLNQAKFLESTFPTISVCFLWWGQSEPNSPELYELDQTHTTPLEYKSIAWWETQYLEKVTNFSTLISSLKDKYKKEYEKSEKKSNRGFGDILLSENEGKRLIQWSEDAKLEPIATAQLSYKAEERTRMIKWLYRKNIRLIMDTSVTGAGKSHFVGNFNVNDTGHTRAVYISSDHSNPTNDNIARRYKNIQPRHSGGKVLGNGKFSFRNVREDEIMVPSNCARAEEFLGYFAKGFDGSSLAETPCGTCPHFSYCHLKEGDGYGYRKQRRDAFAKENRYLRCDIQQLPKDYNGRGQIAFVDEGDKNLKILSSTSVDYLALKQQLQTIYENEDHDSMNFKEKLRFLEEGIDRIFLEAKGNNFGLEHNQIIQLFEDVPDKYQMLSWIPKLTEILLPDFRKILTPADEMGDMTPDAEFLNTKAVQLFDDYFQSGTYDGIIWKNYFLKPEYKAIAQGNLEAEALKALKKWESLCGKNIYNRFSSYERTRRATKNYFIQQVAAENLEKLGKLPGASIISLINLLSSKVGALRADGNGEHRKLVITLPKREYVNVLSTFDTVMIFDATLDIKTTRKVFGLPEYQVIETREELPSYSNLTLISVDIPGVGSSNISDTARKRLDIATEKIKENAIEDYKQKILEKEGRTLFSQAELDNVVGIIGRKKDGDEYYWHHHNRGSNTFYERRNKVLICKGAPWAHIGSCQDVFRTIYGDCESEEAYNEEFARFYAHKVGAEIEQVAGRLRHQWRADESLLIYFLASNLDLDFMNKKYGVRVKNLRGFDIHPEAGERHEAFYDLLMGIGKTLFNEKGEVPTQAEIAKHMSEAPTQAEIAKHMSEATGEVSQSAIAQFSKRWFGVHGWEEIRRRILDPLTELKRTSNNFIPFSSLDFPPKVDPRGPSAYGLGLGAAYVYEPLDFSEILEHYFDGLNPYERGMMIAQAYLYASDWELGDLIPDTFRGFLEGISNEEDSSIAVEPIPVPVAKVPAPQPMVVDRELAAV